jgi:threonine/homoserine/homoserine lactone efflux protein
VFISLSGVMALILFGFATWADAPLVGPVVGIAGGLVLLWMGISMVVSVRDGLPAMAPEATDGSAFRAGVLLTVANPYFLVWWLSVGAALLLRSTEYGGVSIVVFAGAHWLCDLAWLWFLSAAVHRGGRAFGPRFSRLVVASCGLFLLVMGVDFLADGIGALRAARH